MWQIERITRSQARPGLGDSDTRATDDRPVQDVRGVGA
jgi:hypothetical protein